MSNEAVGRVESANEIIEISGSLDISEEQTKTISHLRCWRAGKMRKKQVASENLVVKVSGISKMQPNVSRLRRKTNQLLVNLVNEDSKGDQMRDLTVGTIDAHNRQSYRLNQRQQVRLCWATMIFVALAILVPMELNHFQQERHRPSTVRLASGAIVKPQGMNRELEKQIVDKILGEGYDKRIRPSGINNKTGQNDGPAVVRVNTFIRSISKIDDVTMEYSVQLSLRQEWVDERLAFNKLPSYKNYNINSITLTEQERLWKPDLFFRNEKEGHFHKIIMPNVLIRIGGDGAVLYSIRISLVLACPMDLKYYPLDKQNCTIEMASYGYLDDDLKFMWKENDPVQINPALTLPRFTLETFNTAFCTSRTSTGAYSCLRVDLIFKREFSYYLIQIYIPCCMLVIVSWVSFWLDPNAIPARVSLGVTTLLTMATQISGINASLPPVSYTKAIDVWTGVCLTFVFGALLEFALVNYASRSDAHARMQQARQEEELRAREFELRQQLAANMVQHQQHQQRYNPYGQFPANRNDTLNGKTGKLLANGQLQQHQAAVGGAPPVGGLPNGLKTNGIPQKQYTVINTNQADQMGNITDKQLMAGSSPVFNGLNTGSNKQNCEIHHSLLPHHHHHHQVAGSASGAGAAGSGSKKNVNFCRAWLNKFPSRSKRIDVISRIFFPKMFALFNLVYWTTYLFREDEIARS